MLDEFGREINYLRISVTDRCNLRCRYCNPYASTKWLPHEEILTFEEIKKICVASSHIGIKKIRLTGGEPLVRPNFIGLLSLISGIDKIEKICITTNGVLLEEFSDEIIRQRVKHINISLDTLKRDRFHYITGMDFFNKVWNGIEKAISLGFNPIKINTVIMYGINDDEIVDIARLTLKYPLNVRFIEYMPIGCHSDWGISKVVSSDTIRDIVEKNLGELTPVSTSQISGPANIFRLKNALANIGFISPITRHFCNLCNRIRLTSDGRLRLCLFSDEEVDLKNILRNSGKIEDLIPAISYAVKMKPKSHLLQETKRKMSAIGG